jgi:glutamate synthase (NADPH) large chain
VGFIVNMKGVKSHALIHKGIEILVNLEHRGACGCEDNTGDGAGLLFQVPDKFFRRVLGERGVSLPAEGRYGVGMGFLPADLTEREKCVRSSRKRSAKGRCPRVA